MGHKMIEEQKRKGKKEESSILERQSGACTREGWNT
jgi:hypothetical protein